MLIKNILKSGNQRTAIIKMNVFYGVILKGLSIFISLILVPLTINYVSIELYGIWLTLSSIMTWLSFFDIGFGLGMRNKLTESISLHNIEEGKIYVSTTYFSLILIFGTIGLLGYWGFAYIDWCTLLNVSREYNVILITASRIVLISFCVNVVVQLILNVFQAYQRTAVANLINTLGNVVCFISIFILTKTVSPSLPLLTIVFCYSPVIVLIFISIIKYSGEFSEISPSFSNVKISYAKEILNLGTKFFLLQIISIVLYQSTNFIISHYCGPKEVAIYNVAYKYLNCAIMLLTIVTTPLWSACTDAYAKKDFDWLKKTYEKLKFCNGLLIAVIIFMVFISPIVYQLWLGEAIVVPLTISILLGMYNILLTISNMHSAILCGIGKIRLQVIQAIIQGIIYVPTVLLLVQKYAIIGILIALIISAVIPSVVLTIQVNLIVNQKAKGIFNK